MSCQITLKGADQYDVNAPNGNTSILFKSIESLPEMKYGSQALDSWMKVYTDSFKEWYGLDWQNLSEEKRTNLIEAGYLDSNGEPALFYRGDVTDLESFNYSPEIGKFGQGVYLAQNIKQAESFAAETGKKVYPVFLKPTDHKIFNDKLAFLRAVGEFHNIKVVPTSEQVKSYVESQHLNNTTIIGNGIFGKEYNTASKNNVKSIFSQGFEIKSGALFDAASNTSSYTEASQKESKSDQFIQGVIQRLMNNLGMTSSDVEHVTATEAALITKDTKNPWSGQSAFFHKGKAYFVRGKVTYNTVIHEFAHPLVKGIKIDNPKLFNKLYTDVLATTEGPRLLAEARAEYPELDVNHEQVQEEVIVKAMTHASKAADSLDISEQPSSGLMKVINKIMYALKQMFRKMSNAPVKVENLSLDTTVEELADMLITKEWNLNMSTVKEEDIVAYFGEEQELEAELDLLFKGGKNIAQSFKIIDDNIKEHRALITEAKKNGDYETIKLVLRMPLGDLTLDAIKKNMSEFSKTKRVNKKKERRRAEDAAETLDEKKQIEIYNLEAELDEIQERNEAMAKSLILMDVTAKKARDHIQTLVDFPDQKEAFRQISFYTKLLTGYERQVANIKDTLMSAGLQDGSTLSNSLIELEGTIAYTQDKASEVIEKGVSQILSDKYNEYYAPSVPATQKEIDILQKKLASAKTDKHRKHIQEQIEEKEDKKANLLIAPETMRKYLIGQMGDIGFISSQFENFISSQDAAISSLAAYVKENGFKVDVITQQGMNKLLLDIKNDIEALGITPDQLDKFSDQLLFKDKSTRRNPETGELEDYEVFTFLNEHQNYKNTLSVLNEALRKAEELDQDEPTTQSFQKVAELTELIQDHKRLYYRNENVDEYYEPDENLLNATVTSPDGKIIPIGQIAKEEARVAFQDVLKYQTQFADNDVDALNDYETGGRLLADYRKLFSLYDDYGKKKVDNPSKGEYALTKAKLLLKNRQEKRKFHDYVPIENAFQNSYKGFMVKLRTKLELEGMVPETDEFNNELELRKQRWLNANTHTKNKQSFYDTISRAFEQISAIMDRANVTDEFAVQREQLLESLKGRKDDNGQPIGTELTPQMLDRIKEVEQEIEDIKASPEYKSALKSLPPGDKDTVIALYKVLGNLQQKQATKYYIDIVNEYYQKIQQGEGDIADHQDLDEQSVNMLLDPTYVHQLFEKSEEFKEWYLDNHILKTQYFEGGQEQQYHRTRAWNVNVPKDKAKYSETTDIFDDAGRIIETINGVPNMQYSKRIVKDRYKTGYDKTTGEVDDFAHFDIQGYQLPKSLEDMRKIKNDPIKSKRLDEHNKRLKALVGMDGVTWDYYQNHQYNDLKSQGGDRFNLLQKIKTFHHQNQDGLDRMKTLGYELPRERMDKFQYLTSGEAKAGFMERTNAIGKGVTALFGKKADDFDRNYNYEEQEVNIGAEAYQTEQGTKIPIRGKYNIDTNQVSRDVLNSVFTYYYSATENKLLKEIQPIAEAVRELANNKPQKLYEIKKGRLRSNMLATAAMTKGMDNNRKATIDGMVDVLFEGKGLKESHNVSGFVKTHNIAVGIASHSFFSLDLVSALKNHFGAQFQIGLEAIGGKYYNMSSYYRGRPWAVKAMSKISMEIYKDVPKSLEVQMIDVFDAIQGRNKEKFGESASRSLGRDTLNMSWMTSTRKWLESQATLQIFSAMMHHTKVEQNGKTIRYVDAFELDPKTQTIKLKEGIDQKWAPGNTEFNKTRAKMHEVSGLLQGLYDQQEQGIINRNLAFRSLGALKKYFYKMFMNRYAAGGITTNPSTWLHPQERKNLATGEGHMGFYWQNILTIKEMLKSAMNGQNHLAHLNQNEKRGLLMGVFGMAKLYALYLAQTLILASFGTDWDDKKKWSKVKKATGGLPSPLTNEKWAKDFNLSGWSRAHALLLLMDIQGEGHHFVPLPGMGLTDMYNVVTFKDSIAMNASYESILKMLGLVLMTATGNEKANYKRDTGALKVKEADTNKLWYKLLKMGGVSGKLIDPTSNAQVRYNLRNR